MRSGELAPIRLAMRSRASSQWTRLEAGIASPAQHRVRQPPELVKLAVRFSFERSHVGEQSAVHRRGGVEAQQPEPHVADMDLVERPVRHPRRPVERNRRRRRG